MQELTPAASALAEARGPTPASAVPGPGLGERIEARIDGEERRSASRDTLRTATVSALAAAAAVVLGLDLARSDQAPGPVLEAVSVDETGTVEATADLVAHTWGTEIKLTASGLNAVEAYQVAVLDARGAAGGAGTFVGTDAEIRCNLDAALLREEAEGFVVRDQEGHQVLRSDFATSGATRTNPGTAGSVNDATRPVLVGRGPRLRLRADAHARRFDVPVSPHRPPGSHRRCRRGHCGSAHAARRPGVRGSTAAGVLLDVQRLDVPRHRRRVGGRPGRR